MAGVTVHRAGTAQDGITRVVGPADVVDLREERLPVIDEAFAVEWQMSEPRPRAVPAAGSTPPRG